MWSSVSDHGLQIALQATKAEKEIAVMEQRIKDKQQLIEAERAARSNLVIWFVKWIAHFNHHSWSHDAS